MVTVTVEIGERELVLPARYEVCGRCEGNGSHVNPAVDGHGISEEEMGAEPDFRHAYFSGAFDVACEVCGGKRVVAVLDRERFEGSPARERLLARVDEADEADEAYERECRAERAMGC